VESRVPGVVGWGTQKRFGGMMGERFQRDRNTGRYGRH
jgi:hypothetical protein